MRVRGLIAVCAVLVLCGTPLASAMTDRTSRALAGSPPVITVPADITTQATSPDGANVSFTVDFSDPDNDLDTFGCVPASGSLFPIATTTVTCNATDLASNTATPASFTVTVTPQPPPPDTTAPTIHVPGDFSVEATSGSGAIVTYSASADDPDDPVASFGCTPASASTFPLGSSTVNCDATDSHGNHSSASFTVSVVDTTPPSVGGVPDVATTTTNASGTVITYTKPTATDVVDGSVVVNCTKDSGDNFPVGHTLVVCSATDAHGKTGSSSFNVDITLVDTTPPVLSGGPADISTTTESPDGKVINYTKPTANDNIDGPLSVSCTTEPGLFPVGHTHVVCSATDLHGNTGSAPFNVDIALVDTTKPVLSGVPGNIAENTEVPTGKAISYTAPTANDNLDGPLGVTCTPASGTNFVVGSTPVTCSATDAHGNKGEASFSVVITLIDITKPVLSNVPADITIEANGPSGSQANFVPPTAVDNLDGPIPAVPCTPASGSTFPLGQTTVTCSATDAHGNTGTATFKVNVVDTTPPTLIAPGDTQVYATSEAGSDGNDQGPITRFVFGFHVADIADPSPKVTSNPPAFFPVGTTTVTFTATDASGNKASASAKLTVRPKPAPGTTPPPLPPPSDNKPPGPVTNVQAKGGDGRAIFKWTNPTDPDFDHTEITRTTSVTSSAATGTVVYSGKGTTYTDKGLQNGNQYRYVLVSVDKNGNKSAGVATVVVPKKALLKTPADGARLKQLPKRFVWLADPKAAYYNLQLYVGGTLLFKSTAAANPTKILSTWTTAPFFVFKSPWKWEGRSYKMTKGVYTWYVWPGYGAREAAKYGPLMGSATFQVTPAPAKPKAKPKKPKKP
jgi:hypothetical protein